MGFRINTNIGAMNAHNNANTTSLNVDRNLESLSSGLRINTASDDASGITIADSLRQQLQGLSQAIRNVNEGIGLVQTADGALDEYVKIIGIIRVKSIQAASDGQNSESRVAIQTDISKLLQEAQNIVSSTKFNGQTLLDGSFKNKSFHVGAYAGQNVNISINSANINEIAKVEDFSFYEYTSPAFLPYSGVGTGSRYLYVDMSDGVEVKTSILQSSTKTSQQIATQVASSFNSAAVNAGKDITASIVNTTGSDYGIEIASSENFTIASIKPASVLNAVDTQITETISSKDALFDVDVTTRDLAEEAIKTTDRALVEIDSIRSDIGSVQNQLESTIRNISITHVNVQSAESQIRDVDFADESSKFAKLNVMSKSGSYAMSQANALQRNVLKLLR